MKFGSVFSGIGGADLGLERAGMECAWQIEIEPFCLKVLEHHWPNVRRYGDVKTVNPANLEPINLLVGGFPCQDLSVAGKRKGLAGERSSLFWEFMRLALALKPRWILIENVPGLLSSNEGRDMGTLLGVLADGGYGWSYRVLNSQFWGVPQRRRRVYVVGHLGGVCPPEILFEPEGGSGDTQKSGEEGKRVAPTIARSLISPGIDKWDDTLSTYVIGGRSNKPREYSSDPKGGGSLGVKWDSVSYTVDGGNQAVAQPLRAGRRISDSSGNEGNVVMAVKGVTHGVITPMSVHRLTPLECERLQGFPDGWTDIPRATDGPRYKALGNAMTVNVLEWIGRRIMADQRLDKLVQ